MNLSRNLTLKEFEASDTANKNNISNFLPPELLPNATYLATHCFEAIRSLLGVPLNVTSGYRNEELNKLVHGQPNSQHKTACAIDFVPAGINLNSAFLKIMQSDIPFDQLIYEHDGNGNYWIHVSCKSVGNRHEVISNLLKKVS
jgi:hypothetical protein